MASINGILYECICFCKQVEPNQLKWRIAAALLRYYWHQEMHPAKIWPVFQDTQLHLLPVQFKLATLTFKALHTGGPPYLSDLLQYHESTRSLCSSSTHQLSVPRHNLTFGSRAFRFSAPRVWNSLPVSIHESQSLPTFRRHLKTFYSQSPYPLSAVHLA